MRFVYLSIVIIVAVATGFFLLFSRQDSTPTQVWGGRIVEVKENSIVVDGTIIYLGQVDSGRRETRIIEFRIKPETVLTKRVIYITREQIESRQQFTPERKDFAGSFGDFKAGVDIHSITSSANLFNANKATGDEIIYFSHEIEPRQ